MNNKVALIAHAALALCLCSVIAMAGEREAELAAQFQAAAPADRAKLVRRISHTAEMATALLPLLQSRDASLRADTAYVLRGFYRRALEPAAPALSGLLAGDPDWRVRANAAYALMTLTGNAAALAAFEKCTADRDERVRAACAKGVGAVAESPHAVDAKVASVLTTALGDPSRLVRYGAAAGLTEWKSTDTTIVRALAARLDVEPDPWVRGQIARAIAAAGAAAEPALPALTRAVLDPLPLYTADRVVAAMAAIGAPAVPVLVATLGYRGPPGSPHAGRAAAWAKTALVKLDAPMTAPLVDALEHGPTRQRQYAAAVLGEKGAQAAAAVPALAAALTDDDADVRKAAAASLGRLTAYDTDALPPLLRALDDSDASVRRAAVEALRGGVGGGFVSRERALAAGREGKPVPGPLEVLPPPLATRMATALAARLDDPDFAVAGIAANTLGKMGAYATPALGALKAAMLAPKGNNNRAAADALGALGTLGAPALVDAVRNGASPGDRSGIGIRGRAAANLATLAWRKQLGDQAGPAAAAMLAGLSDSRSDVRSDVAEALGALGQTKAAPSMKTKVVATLEAAIPGESEDNARQAMQSALQNWEKDS